MNRRRKFLMILAHIAMLAVGIVVVMLLWNWLMPTLFGIKLVNFWQAAGILILAKVLFGRIHPFMHGHPMIGRPDKMGPEFTMMHKKMKGMSREERLEYIRNRWNQEHGPGQAAE